MEIQDLEPEIKESLEKVGVANLKTVIKTKWRGKRLTFFPEVELTIDLPPERRGAHLSRLVEVISEVIEEEVWRRYPSVEALGRHILESLRKRHSFEKAELQMAFDFVVEGRTPVTKRRSFESHRVAITLNYEAGELGKTLRVEVVGNTTCPHALELCGKTHIQRALAVLEISCDFTAEVALEDMIRCVEDAFPSRPYTLLKAEDERGVVEQIHSNPKFVEDVARSVLANVKQRFGHLKGLEARVRVISQESIHRHNVVAEGRIRV